MKLARVRAGVTFLFATLLQACGGGGGGDGGGGGGGGGSNASMTVNKTSISVSATPGEQVPMGDIVLRITNVPDKGLHLEAQSTNLGLETLVFAQATSSKGAFHLTFHDPGALENGTYTDQIEIRVCNDAACQSQIQGSPATVTTSYVVEGTGVGHATLDRSHVEFFADARDVVPRIEAVRLTLDQDPYLNTHASFTNSSNALGSVDLIDLSLAIKEFALNFRRATDLNDGVYDDELTFHVCYHESCVREVEGSPFTVSTRMTVGITPEPGLEPLVVEQRSSLLHDIIDAEFDAPRNLIVMVSGVPANRLYVYNIATKKERHIELSALPTSVSVAPDGLTAAVGHNFGISVVDLTTVGQVPSPVPLELSVTADVFDLVLDGAGSVHAWASDELSHIHSVDIASNTEQLSVDTLNAGTYGKLDAAGTSIYTTNFAFFPEDFGKWDISSGSASFLHDSPYNGEFLLCGRIWIEQGNIYSGCGNVFSTNANPPDDLIHQATLELPTGTSWGVQIQSLSVSAARNEIALIEHDTGPCDVTSTLGYCYSHFALYDATQFNRTALFTIGPVVVDGRGYSQRGLFVFHDPATGKKYLISKLDDMPHTNARYYISIIP